MIVEVDRLEAEFLERKLPAFRIGIGINTAVVTAGNMGSEARLNYTVIGDGVNLASRLQGLTKEISYHARVIAGEATLEHATGVYHTRPLGEAHVKGRERPIRIFAVDS